MYLHYATLSPIDSLVPKNSIKRCTKRIQKTHSVPSMHSHAHSAPLLATRRVSNNDVALDL